MQEALESAQALLHRALAAGEAAYEDADFDMATARFLLGRVLNALGSPEQALPLLNRAKTGFEAVGQCQPGCGAERMASVASAERGDCLIALGRLDEAATIFEESICRAAQRNDIRDCAVGEFKLAAVRELQSRFTDALEAYGKAREKFGELDEPYSVAVTWHQSGVAYQRAGQSEAAEDAYRRSLAIKTRYGSAISQASTLVQLGTLYDDALNRPEEAAAFFRQAADTYANAGDQANEGKARSNLALALLRLRRHDEARQEIVRAIERLVSVGHAGEPWRCLGVLAEIEAGAGNAAAAEETKGRAVESFLAYRRDGGENHNADGRICLAATQALKEGGEPAAAALLNELAADPEAKRFLPFIRALQAVVAGSRDRTLADDPGLSYTEAAEILFMIETLEKAP
jgi:tetratricopeptide (TPR) repeat protein